MLRSSVLGRRLLVFIITFSFFITFITSAAILFYDYKAELKVINSSISRIEAVYLPSISASLWNYDNEQLTLQLEGIGNFAGVITAQVIDQSGDLIQQYGSNEQQEAIESYQLPLGFDDGDGVQSVGQLTVGISKDAIYENLINKGIVILTSQLFKTLTVSLFILFLVYKMITQHLIKISSWAKDIKIESFDNELILNRKQVKFDELSIVTDAFNALRLNVRKYHKQMKNTQADLEQLNLELEDRVNNRTKELKDTISELKEIRNKIEMINKNTQDSIRYASLIQNSIIPAKEEYDLFFSESFVYWQPRNIVGGDIYFFDVLKNKKECISMVIDCTGHGVPGAFVTMLVKAIERNIINVINYTNEDVKVSNILSDFNTELKKILKQEGNSKALANVGFDGAVVYFNKEKNILKYSGGNTPLFYVENDELKMIKGDKQSVGYKSSDSQYEFNEYVIPTKSGMTFYLTSDGYIDQNGGKNLFPFSKKKFKKLISENYKKPLLEQRDIFVDAVNEYRGSEEQTDDITLMAMRV